ncbi:hypothetical protein [Tessaracoccus defluvii]|uniref:Fenitrothion hydrolase n=1 Tax=Tessaracoccus defluvii TaxID=1285901 RepID=A0A7H0H8N3_9ACTN|nr:hypothetical protein [Tessaracoccus defluvii]QNP56899.1 hypothetical protein H9L22_06035 [Tessaracoccus defluvii]
MILLHGIASRHDLPLPLPLVLAGAAVVLIITFWVALFAWRTSRYEEEEGRELPRLSRFIDSPAVSRTLRLAVGVVWLVAAAALFLGVDRIDNPAIGFVYVWLWVGLVPVALLLGGVYERSNPWRLLFAARGATSPTWRAPEAQRRASVLPAAAAALVFSYLELAQPGGATLPVLRWFALAWAAWMVIGTLVAPAWIGRADPFEAYASAVARLSPWARSKRGVLMWTNPLRNLASWKAPRHLTALASVLLGATLFDAVSNTAAWVRATQGLGTGVWPLATGMLLVCVGGVYGLFRLGTLSYRELRADDLAPGLIPLVVGYALAHYGTMLYLEGQRTLFRFSDPLGRGWNVLGLIEAAPHTALFGVPTLVAVVQVGLIVGGHALGVLVSHDIALRSGVSGVRPHLPLLLVMVVFTVGGLLLMFGG